MNSPTWLRRHTHPSPTTWSLANQRVQPRCSQRCCSDQDSDVIHVRLAEHHYTASFDPSVKLRHHLCFPVDTTDLPTALYIFHWWQWRCFHRYEGAENDVDSFVLYRTNCIRRSSALLSCHSPIGYVPVQMALLTVANSLSILLFSSFFKLSHPELCLLPESCRSLSCLFVIPQS